MTPSAELPQLQELAHTDWLYHRLRVTGPASCLGRFRDAARGPGTIPWRLDLDRMEEDWCHLLLAPPPPQRRTLSLEGGRILAGQLREAVARRREKAADLANRSVPACPLDLNRLVPIPQDILRLGPDNPQSRAWLWQSWGTSQGLRHVAERAGLEDGAFQLVFWAADWTPWRAFSAIRAAWPALRFDLQPVYDGP